MSVKKKKKEKKECKLVEQKTFTIKQKTFTNKAKKKHLGCKQVWKQEQFDSCIAHS